MKKKATLRTAKASSRQSTLNFPTSSKADVVAASATAETSTKSDAKNRRKLTADNADVADKEVRPSVSSAKSAVKTPAFETGEQLLARILTERRQNWQGRGQYKEPAEPGTTNLPPIPEGWTWARLEQLGLTFGGLTKNPKRVKLPKQLPYLRVANVYANELRLDEIEHIGVEDSELEKLLVHAGDLLIVEGNGSKTQIGRLAIWDGSIERCVHQNHIIKVRPVDARMPKWILHWLQSPNGRHFVELVASSTSGLYTLKENTLKRSDLDDFVACYNQKNRNARKESERFKSFSYDELTKRDKLNLDIFWLKDDALEQFATIAEDLK